MTTFQELSKELLYCLAEKNALIVKLYKQLAKKDKQLAHAAKEISGLLEALNQERFEKILTASAVEKAEEQHLISLTPRLIDDYLGAREQSYLTKDSVETLSLVKELEQAQIESDEVFEESILAQLDELKASKILETANNAQSEAPRPGLTSSDGIDQDEEYDEIFESEEEPPCEEHEAKEKNSHIEVIDFDDDEIGQDEDEEFILEEESEGEEESEQAQEYIEEDEEEEEQEEEFILEEEGEGKETYEDELPPLERDSPFEEDSEGESEDTESEQEDEECQESETMPQASTMLQQAAKPHADIPLSAEDLSTGEESPDSPRSIESDFVLVHKEVCDVTSVTAL